MEISQITVEKDRITLQVGNEKSFSMVIQENGGNISISAKEIKVG